jgi:hypothetical protein
VKNNSLAKNTLAAFNHGKTAARFKTCPQDGAETYPSGSAEFLAFLRGYIEQIKFEQFSDVRRNKIGC